jgi:hypothetical protein
MGQKKDCLGKKGRTGLERKDELRSVVLAFFVPCYIWAYRRFRSNVLLRGNRGNRCKRRVVPFQTILLRQGDDFLDTTELGRNPASCGYDGTGGTGNR